MREEIILEAKPRDILYKIRKSMIPFVNHPFPSLHGDNFRSEDYLRYPVIEGNTLTVSYVNFFIMGEIREPSPPDEVFRFEITEVDATRIKVIGECEKTLNHFVDIFNKVWKAALIQNPK
jgi:hypothetical protein